VTDHPTPTTDDSNRPIQLSGEAALDALCADTDRVLVELYTDGCGICSSMEPVLGSLAQQLDIAVAQLNPRDDPPLVERFDVRSVPLFVLFIDGTPVARLADGFVPGAELESWVDEHTG
jgi:thioredoxin 1